MSTDLEAALLAAAPKQWDHFQRNRLKREKGKPKWQREIDKVTARAEEVRRRYDPELMRINDNLERKTTLAIGLHCPKCGDGNMGNKVQRKPWCIKCNVALESPFLVKKRLPDIKILPKTRRLDVTFRRNE